MIQFYKKKKIENSYIPNGPMKEEFLRRMKYIMVEGGRMALSYMNDSSPTFKADQSILTKTDSAVSDLVHRVLEDFLQEEEHILIDEEDDDRGKYFDPEILEKATYVWALDPIDGTRVYANRMPHFGISLGVLRDLKPWIGMIYFPFLKELFYCDGEYSYFIQNAFQKEEHITRIQPIDQEINGQSIFFCNDNFFQHFQWDYKDCHLMIAASGVVDLLWPTIGRGCGALTKCYLWDFAGVWPIVHNAGLHFRSVSSDKILDCLDLNLFHRERIPWKMKDFYILSSEKNFSILKGKMKWRD